MRPFYIAALSLFVLFSCNSNGNKKSSYRQKSVGNINSLQIVIADELWTGVVGEELRKYFAAPVDGLPQDEPIFSINQLNPSDFTGFMRSNRIFIKVSLGENESVKITKDPYARPQTGAIFVANTEARLVELISENQERIIAAFYKSEIKERQRRTLISPKKIDSLQEYFGLSIKIPTAYRIASKSKDFYWLRKDLKNAGSTNIIIYEVPLNLITNDSLVLSQIIRIRDSVGGGYLPVEDDAKFITEQGYSTSLYHSEIDGKFAYETKGIWEVEGAFMAGPFINFAIYDEKNNRYLIIEGFTYAPSVSKRNFQFELESIIRSAKIK